MQGQRGQAGGGAGPPACEQREGMGRRDAEGKRAKEGRGWTRWIKATYQLTALLEKKRKREEVEVRLEVKI